MRIIIVSTPRSGNTWLRLLLAGLYDLQQYAVHTPDALDWAMLPENCIVQLHWHWSPAFATMLGEHNFRVLTICRHPLDVLVSILQFAPHEPQTACWLSGECGNEKDIYGKSVTSSEFLSYAVSCRARVLLSVSHEWWHTPGVTRIRYEDLVHDTSQILHQLSVRLGECKNSISQVVESNTIDKLRLLSSNRHFWRGQPYLWKTVIPADVANVIETKQTKFFSDFGYQCDPDLQLTHSDAERRWYLLSEGICS